MNKTVRVVILALCGMAGGWIGYWLGHLLGWSEDAEWPSEIGGGGGAILLSMGMAVAFVVIARALISLRPPRPKA